MRFFCYRQYLLELVVAVEGGFGSLAGSLSPLRTLRSARALRFRSLPPCSPSALPARAHTVSDRVSLQCGVRSRARVYLLRYIGLS